MTPRRALVLACTVLSVSAHAGAECDGALSTATGSELPAPIDLDRRVPELYDQIRELVRRDANVVGTNNAMLVLNGQIRPVLDAVANYLSSPDNAGALRPHEATRLADELIKDLNARLDVLKGKAPAEGGSTRWNWMTLRHEPKGRSVEDQVSRIRYLRFALDAAVARIERDAPAWPETLVRARALRARLAEVQSLVVQIASRLDVETDDWTFKLRLENLIEDVRNQSLLLEGALSAIEHKIHLANAILDHVRTLLLVRFSLEAVMGDQPLDLSPLEPPKVQSTTPPPVVLPSVNPELELAIRAIRRTVNDMSKNQAKREVLVQFVQANARELSPAQAIVVATCTTSSDTTDAILTLYARLRHSTLSQTQILEIAAACRSDDSRKSVVALIEYKSSVPTQPRERFGVLR